jgi:hypothetical protein
MDERTETMGNGPTDQPDELRLTIYLHLYSFISLLVYSKYETFAAILPFVVTALAVGEFCSLTAEAVTTNLRTIVRWTLIQNLVLYRK